MSAASDYLELKILDHIFGKASFAQPNIYAALLKAVPNDSDTGLSVNEADYTDYNRVLVVPGDWNAAAAGQIDNANEITFPQCGGGSNTIVAMALIDASSGGNLLLYGALAESLAVSNLITPRFVAGSVVFSAN